jgi:hypothetical protein
MYKQQATLSSNARTPGLAAAHSNSAAAQLTHALLYIVAARCRLFAKARQVYGKYKSHLAADDERYLRGRLHAGVTAALALKLSLERESAGIDSSSDAQQQQDEQDADLLAPREARIEEVSQQNNSLHIHR